MTDKEFFSFFVYLFFDVHIPLELKAFQVILPASTGQMDQRAMPLFFFFWFSPFNVQLDGFCFSPFNVQLDGFWFSPFNVQLDG